MENGRHPRECGKYYCRVCKTMALFGHHCDMQPIYTVEESEIDNADIIEVVQEKKEGQRFVCVLRF